MKTALIGHTGFVGSTLAGMLGPLDGYRSTNIGDIRGKEYGHMVCAGVQAMKWWANKEPEADWAGIQRLLDALENVRAERVTLLSTIDVYPVPRGVDERTEVAWENNHPYGKHRYMVEDWFRGRFPRLLVVRLPGLFGPGLKKNVIFDMLHDNDLHKVHPGGVFQYYDTRRLAADMARGWELGVALLNIASEPVATAAIRDACFPGKILAGEGENPPAGPAPAGYDMKSIHAGAWGGRDGYLYSREQVMADLADWLGTEQR
jgi:hypothetical protein